MQSLFCFFILFKKRFRPCRNAIFFILTSKATFVAMMVLTLFFLEACRSPKTDKSAAPPDVSGVRPEESDTTHATRMGWAIQAGAFSQLENAVRLSDNLSNQGLDATYFRDSDNLYKVRFGDFPNKDAARNKAEALLSRGILEAYYLVAPDSLPASKIGDPKAETGIRKSLVKTAESYLGIPYRWGGTSPKTGFDCSGLTQAVYRLNGLSIPRSSKDQFAKGKSVSKARLRGGDLLFFATGKGSGINHVAIYIENGVFIHAPKPGQLIRRDNLSNPVLSKQFVGARSYVSG